MIEYNMNHLPNLIMKMLTFFLVIISGLKFSSAQQPDKELSDIKEAIDKSIRLTFHKNRELRLVVASMFITFSDDAAIENIFFSEAPEGLIRSRETSKELIKKINQLNLDRDLFSNKYIIAILIVASSKRVPQAETEIPENWNLLFKGIETQILSGKDLKFCIPIEIQYLGSITD